MTKIITFNGSQKDADFFIQSKGKNAGRPLNNPTKNCFAVYTDVNFAYEIVYSMKVAGVFEAEIIGSVIPFIRISKVRELVLSALKKEYTMERLNAINSIDPLILNLQRQIKLMEEMKKTLANSILK